MAEVVEKLTQDLKSAMLARDASKVEVIKSLKSAILYEEVAQKKRDSGLSDDEAIAVLKRESKKRADAAELYKKGGNQELANKELSEKEVIDVYLPELMDEAATESLVDQAVSDLEIEDLQQTDMGRVIGEVKKRGGAGVDAALVAKIVKSKINQ